MSDGVEDRLSLVLRLRSLDLPSAGPKESDGGWVPASPQLAAWALAVEAAAADACFLLDGSGVIRAVSPPAAELLGVDHAALLGRWLLDVLYLVDFDEHHLPGDYADRLAPLLVLRSRGLMRGLLRIRRGDGLIVTFDCASSAVRALDGSVVGSLSFLVDVARQ